MPKYISRKTYVNDLDAYKEMIEDRGVTNIEHFLTFILNNPNYSNGYVTYEHVWKKGDKLYKLASRFYGNVKYWWVIALYNNKPTDAHYRVGDIVEIPISPEEVIAEIVS